ncbi:MAG: F0F1 ATP synthase subunit epsilon [Clostridia bacterium]|nr:F0F1 ATP synthase subunit epsilon [Clostridia bacterium]MDD4798652.1 F0F1 ATP synthase subunit epsilon [Clostridia bacterium]
MSEDKIYLEIVTPEGEVLREMVSAIVVPAAMGSMGIMADHAPLVTALDIGVLEYTKADQKYKIAITSGFMEVKDNEVMVLVQAAERPEEIDFERAEKARQRAEARLAQKKVDDIDYIRAQAALERALNRLQFKA